MPNPEQVIWKKRTLFHIHINQTKNMFGGGGKEDEGGDVADEGDWYAALVAGEHVGDWLDIIKVRACFVHPNRFSVNTFLLFY